MLVKVTEKDESVLEYLIDITEEELEGEEEDQEGVSCCSFLGGTEPHVELSLSACCAMFATAGHSLLSTRKVSGKVLSSLSTDSKLINTASTFYATREVGHPKVAI